MSFLDINTRVPGSYVGESNQRAVSDTPVQPKRLLVVGQKTSAGSATVLTPYRINTKDAAVAYFGKRSITSEMCRIIKDIAPKAELWAIVIADDAAGVPSVGTIVVSGTATAAGIWYGYIGGYRFKVLIPSGTTPSAAATLIGAAINALTNTPFTASVATATVTITCVHDGVFGNSLDLRFSYYQGEAAEAPTAQTLALTAFATGATNPDLATAIAALGDTQYTQVVNPYVDATNLTAMETEWLRRWGNEVQLEGHLFSAISGNLAAHTGLGLARNCKVQTIMGAGLSPSAPWLWAAALAARDAIETDPALGDGMGGNRPLHSELLAPADADRFDRSERETLLASGISTHIVAADGSVAIERLISTYRLNAQSFADDSYLKRTTLGTLQYIRYDVRAFVSMTWPRKKLGVEGVNYKDSANVVTASSIKNALIARAERVWAEKLGLIENVEQFKADIDVVKVGDSIVATLPPDFINQFMIFDGQVQFLT